MDAYKKAGNRKDEPPEHEMVHFAGLLSSKREFGDFRTVLHTGLYSQIVAMEVPVNGEIGDEVHTVDQILMFTSGRGLATVAGKDQEVKAGDVVVVPAGTQHQFVTRGDQPLELITAFKLDEEFNFMQTSMSEYFSFKREPRFPSEEGGDDQPSSELSLWGSFKKGWKQGGNQEDYKKESTAGHDSKTNDAASMTPAGKGTSWIWGTENERYNEWVLKHDEAFASNYYGATATSRDHNPPVRYLWIDSLCIIQSGDNGKDWEQEVAQMQSVFSQAYCVIAATAASDSYSGFLGQNLNSVESLRVTDGKNKHFYLSTDIDDYDNDVGKAAINTRAWVMQEAVLAKRTIHFTLSQMYWECGKGVYCENLTRLKSHARGKWYTMDSEFPIRLLQQPFNAAVVECLAWLFEDYSRRDITKIEDRPIAISGLETRMSEVLLCNSRFCNPERFLHRMLLWIPTGKGERISHNSAIPSWCWLSFPGGVKFETSENFAFELNANVSFNPQCKDALDADLAAFVDCTFQLEGERCILRDENAAEKGSLKFDVEEHEDFDSLHCIVIARVTEGDVLDRVARLAMQPVPKFPCGAISGLLRMEEGVDSWLVLVVVPTTGNANEYRRVGIGSVSGDCVARVQDHVQIV
ncbi:hypothetical protein E8E13_009547 [Curvularia kusanoi]|uniref:Cupin 2 conserved barrel domain-containing protein n=1 Tax=Curvularia kusanoi TaxID=90978 RepID=A0A9P4WEP9_CURKU|nr:hypothetical protein E8E13_009547 [Curvularia kusanoi]